MMGGDLRRPWTQTREAVMALKELWSSDPAEFHGDAGAIMKLLDVERQKAPDFVAQHSMLPLFDSTTWAPSWESRSKTRASRLCPECPKPPGV